MFVCPRGVEVGGVVGVHFLSDWLVSYSFWGGGRASASGGGGGGLPPGVCIKGVGVCIHGLGRPPPGIDI